MHPLADRRRLPVERFLGPDEAGGGPFALLGLSPDAATDEAVLNALDRQLARMGQHPECDTPEADEVRLALHAAAAQLLDPAVRRHLVDRWNGGAGVPSRTVPPWPATGGQTPHRLLEHDAILSLGMFGGWNQRSLRLLVSLAHARGFSADQVAATLQGLSRTRSAGAHGPTRPSPPPRSHQPAGSTASTPRRGPAQPTGSDDVDPSVRILRAMLIIAGAAVLVLAAGISLLIVLASRGERAGPPKGEREQRTAAIAPETVEELPPPPPVRAEPHRPERPRDISNINRRILESVRALETDPAAAVDSLDAAIGDLAAAWRTLPRDRLVAAHDALVEFIYRAGASRDSTRRALDAIARGSGPLASGSVRAEDIGAGVWSVGMLVRLSREKDLPATARLAIDAKLAEALGAARPVLEPTFEAGALAALVEVPRLLVNSTDAEGRAAVDSWREWAAAVDALAGPDAALRARTLLGGLESLLLLGPEPGKSRAAFEAIGALAATLSWRDAEESRVRLLRWFDDRRITSEDLHAVTAALASRSAAAGVDVTMVLSPAASDRVRAALRDRYARVWGLEERVDDGRLVSDWGARARELTESHRSSGVRVEDLASAVLLARLNEAAELRWRGLGAQAAELIADLDAPVREVIAAPSPTAATIDWHGDSAWAEQYLGARRNIILRQDLLARRSRDHGRIGAVDAEVIATEAMIGAPAEVRARAQDLARQFAGSPAMINAILEMLPRSPRTAAHSALIAEVVGDSLPGARDPMWPTAARRALVERLLERLAAQGPFRSIDALSILLAASYNGMASQQPLTLAERIAPEQPAAHLSAGLLRARWREAAERLTPLRPAEVPLHELDRRRAGRHAQAHGPVQAFAAEQVSLCELLAHLIAAEQPARAQQVWAVMSEMADHRRRARDILHQLAIVERSITHLWLIRFEENPA